MNEEAASLYLDHIEAGIERLECSTLTEAEQLEAQALASRLDALRTF